MDSRFPGSPMSTLKVDFKCTKECPTDVKQNLQEFDGVEAISVDLKQGMVRVIGNVNPMSLVNRLRNMGKKAELWAFQKAPKQEEKMITQCVHFTDSESDSSDSDDDYGHGKHRRRKSKKASHAIINPPPPPMPKANKKRSWKDWFRIGKKIKNKSNDQSTPYQPNYYPPPPPIPRYLQPPPMHYHGPMAFPRPLNARPEHPHGGYYNRMVMPAYRYFRSNHNPMIHYTDYDDNYRCPI